MVKYRHPSAVMKGNGLRKSQSTPALTGVRDISADGTIAQQSDNMDVRKSEVAAPLRLPPVKYVSDGGSLPAEMTGVRTITGVPKSDAHVIADALAHGTSYSALDASSLGKLGDFERAYTEDDEEMHLQQTLAEIRQNSEGGTQMPKEMDESTMRQKQLKKMVKYWAGAEPDVKSDAERKQIHDDNVAALLAEVKATIGRRLQAPKWVKDRLAQAEIEEQIALGLRESPKLGTSSNTDERTEIDTRGLSAPESQTSSDSTVAEVTRRQKARRTAAKDTTYADWVKDRQDFQNVFHRFAYKPRNLTAVALIAAKKHPEERLPDDKATVAQWVSQHFPILTENTQGDDECLELIVNKIRVRDASAGEKIYKKGDDANAFYLVMRGSVRLDFSLHSADGARSTESISRTITVNHGFGEEALSAGALRPVTATALEDGTVLGTVRGFSFRETTHNYTQGLNLRAKRFLTESVPLLAGWSTNRLLALAETAKRGRYLAGQRIGKQGTDIPGLSFIVTGKASIHKEVSYTKANRWPTSQAGDYKEVKRETQVKVKICDIGKGDYFGEEILLGHRQWQGTVIAEEPTEVLSIPRGEGLFTMFRRVAQKFLIHNQREHLQSQSLVAAKHLGDINNRKMLDRQKILCYGVKHRMRLEEVGQKEVKERSQKKWERRQRDFLKRQRDIPLFERSGCLKASLSSPTLGRREPSPEEQANLLREAKMERLRKLKKSPVEPRVRR